MACAPLILLSLLLIISMSSVTHCHNLPITGSSSSTTSIVSSTINGLVPRSDINITGALWCLTPPPSPPIFPPLFPQLNGVNVIFTCDGNTTIADAVTDKNGVYKITGKAEDTLLTILSDPHQSNKCGVIARLPIVGCAVFPPRGFIRAPLGPVHTYENTVPAGPPRVVRQYNAGRFSYYRGY